MTDMNKALSLIKELHETSDISEVAQLLHSGNWIAICATTRKPFKFCLGKIMEERTQDGQGQT